MSLPPDHREEDAALARQAGTGDRAAAERLLTRYQDRLYAVCLRMTGRPESAADLCQDAMLKILRGLATFDARSSLLTWMTRVTMNVCLSHARSERLRRHASLDAPAPGPGGAAGQERAGGGPGGGSRSASDRAGWGTTLASGEPEPGSSVEEDELHARLTRALAALEPEHRAILVLRDVQGLDYDQIAAALSIAEGTVKSRLFRARAALRALIDPPR